MLAAHRRRGLRQIGGIILIVIAIIFVFGFKITEGVNFGC